MGTVRELPVGLSFIGTAGDDANMLAYGYAYEQATQLIATPKFYKSTGDVPEIAKANTPYKEN